MVDRKAQKMQKVGSIDCRSLCSDQYPSGQFKKVSIGIMVDKTPKMGSLARNEDGVSVPALGRAYSCQGNAVEEAQLVEENKRPEIVETLEVQHAEDKGQKASAWFSSRSVRYETPTTESVQFCVNRASIVHSEDGAHKKLDTIVYGKRKGKGETIGNVEEVVEELAFATMQEAEVFDKGVGREEADKVSKCNNETLRMKLWEILGTAPSQNKRTVNSLNPEEGRDDLNINHDREYHSSKISQPKHNSDTIETDSESPNQTKTRPITRSLTRRRAPPKTVSKLQGGISSRKKPLSSASDSKLNLQENNIFAFDGEGKEEALKRTVGGHSNKSKGRRNVHKTAGNGPQRIYPCRPLGSQKGPQANVRGKTLPSPDEASLYSKETGISPSSPSQGKTDSMQTPNTKKKARKRPCRIYSPRQLIPEKKLQSNERETTMPLSNRKSLQSKETGDSPSPCQAKKDFVQTSIFQEKFEIERKKIYSLRRVVSDKSNEKEQTPPSPDRASVQSKEVPNDSKKDFGNLPFADNAENCEIVDNQSLRNKTHSREHVLSTALPNNSYLHREASSLPLQRKTDILDDFPSPTFAMNTTPHLPSSGELLNEGFRSPVPAQPTEKSCRSNIFYNSRPGSYGSDGNPESSDDSRKIYGLRGTEFPHLKEKEIRKNSALSTKDDQETESSDADDFTRKGVRRTGNRFPPNAYSPEKSASTLPQSKSILHGKSSMLYPDAISPNKSPHTVHQSKRVKGLKNTKLIEEATRLSKASDQYSENSLESDVVELALVLERFKAKLKYETSNKSSEILSAAADKIRRQLHDLESQMHADVAKFINNGKSKRKRFESRLQGQQERLKLLHDKFKEEVNQQTQDCRSTLDELEAHRMELKGSTDRQKASYRKFLVQTEEAMKIELRDAESNIAAIDKEARKKMYGLKHVLKEWMEDGVIR